MERLTLVNYDQMIASGVVVVDFFAEWCGPCKMIAPKLEEMSQTLAGKVSFYKVDVDEQEMLSGREAIRAMPTMKVYNNGQLVETIVGANLPKLIEIIDKLVAELPASEAKVIHLNSSSEDMPMAA